MTHLPDVKVNKRVRKRKKVILKHMCKHANLEAVTTFEASLWIIRLRHLP
jgi:hypothetical protein